MTKKELDDLLAFVASVAYTMPNYKSFETLCVLVERARALLPLVDALSEGQQEMDGIRTKMDDIEPGYYWIRFKEDNKVRIGKCYKSEFTKRWRWELVGSEEDWSPDEFEIVSKQIDPPLGLFYKK